MQCTLCHMPKKEAQIYKCESCVKIFGEIAEMIKLGWTINNLKILNLERSSSTATSSCPVRRRWTSTTSTRTVRFADNGTEFTSAWGVADLPVTTITSTMPATGRTPAFRTVVVRKSTSKAENAHGDRKSLENAPSWEDPAGGKLVRISP